MREMQGKYRGDTGQTKQSPRRVGRSAARAAANAKCLLRKSAVAMHPPALSPMSTTRCPAHSCTRHAATASTDAGWVPSAEAARRAGSG